MIRTLIFVSFAGLTGCATTPPVEVQSAGVLPQGSYSIVASPEEAAPAHGELIEQRLRARGLQQADDPKYILQVAWSAKPAPAGILLPEHAPSSWYRNAYRGSAKRTTPMLLISVSDRVSGLEVYRVSAVAAPQKRARDSAKALIDAALPD